MRDYKISLSTLIKYLIYLYIFIIVTNPNTGTTAVKLIRVILAAFLLLYILKFRRFRTNAYISWAIVFLLYNAVMIQFSSYKSYAVEYTMSLLYILVINVGICLFLTKHNVIEGMIKAFIFSTIVEAVITFSQYGLLVFLNTRHTDEGSANTLGFYAAMAFILSIIMYNKVRGRKHKYLFVASSLLCVVIALLSASRKAIIYVAVPLIFYLVSSSRNPVKTFRNTLIAVGIVAVGYYSMMHIPLAYNLLGSRVESMVAGFLGGTTDSSTSTRLRLIEAGMIWFRRKPWFGYGLANFAAMNWAVYGSVYYAHNNYVELLVDCGLVGTVIYYGLYVKNMRLTVTSKSLDRKDKGFIMGITIAFIIGDYGMVSYNFAIFQLILMCLFLAASGKLSMTKAENAFSSEV